MEIILNKEESKKISELLNCRLPIKKIVFETSNIYISHVAVLIKDIMQDISKSARVGYTYNSKSKILTFKNDFQKIEEKLFRSLLGGKWWNYLKIL